MRRNAHPANTGPRSRWRAWALAATALLAVSATSRGAFACGYENPDDLALGMLNWVFPKALHVRAAVWQAEKSGILPPRPAKPAKDLFGGAFRLAAAGTNELGDRLNDATPGAATRPGFSVVLIPAVMWTTYTPTAAGYFVHVHADGPAKGDVVMVTDESVVRALVDGSLDAVTAESYGLVRFYGLADRQHQLRLTLAGLSPAKRGPGDRGMPAPQAEESDPLYCGPGDHDLSLQAGKSARLYSLSSAEQK